MSAVFDQAAGKDPGSDGRESASLRSDAADFTSGNLVLYPEHLAQLKASAIAPKIARDRGYQTSTSKDRLRQLGFGEAQCRPPGLLMPLHDVHGKLSIHQFRPDHPRLNKKGKPVKYETPVGAKMVLDCPPACFPLLSDPSIPLVVTEGIKKADAGASQGLCVVAVLGVWNWRGTNTLDGLAALADWEAVPLKDRTVYIIFDSDAAQKSEVQQGLARLAQYLSSMHATVHVVNLTPGPNAQKTGLDDFFARGGTIPQLFSSTTAANDYSAMVAGNRKESQADALLTLATEHAVFFHDADREAYATIKVGGHYETVKVSSQQFRLWLAGAYFEHREKAAGREAIASAINTLSGLAIFKGEEHKTYVRLAGHDGNIYVDLSDAERQVVEITPTEWRVITNDACPIKSLRTRGMEALPLPVAGGSLEELRPFTNARTDDNDTDFILTVAWLVMALHPTGPYPIAVHNGEQGATKSTRGRVMRRLIDPNKSDLRKEPKDTDDLLIAAQNGRVCAFDNMSGIQPWFSDSLCRLSTGGGIGKRQLYTDSEEIIIDVRRPVILNGITQLVVRGDLMDRALIHDLPNVEDVNRREEEVFWADFEMARSRILGALLDAVVAALRYKDAVRAELKAKVRMADFMVFVAAAEHALPWRRGRFVEAYRANRKGANEAVLDASVIAAPIFQMLAREPGQVWEGTAGDLLKRLNFQRPADEKPPKEWPATPRGMSGALRREAPNLRMVGMSVVFPSPRDHDKRRIKVAIQAPAKTAAEPPNRRPQEKADGIREGVGDGNGYGGDRPAESPEQPPSAKGQKIPQNDNDLDNDVKKARRSGDDGACVAAFAEGTNDSDEEVLG
jgi:hypothetical protein